MNVVKIKRQGGKIVQNCDVYIGRKCTLGGWNLEESKWSNPFNIKNSTRTKCIQQYYNHILDNQNLLNDIPSLQGKVLGCWCKPEPCHGDVLVNLVTIYEQIGPLTKQKIITQSQ